MSYQKYQILRLNIAGYQNPRFLKQEKSFLEKSLPVEVALSPAKLSPGPLILITNTHTDLNKFPPELLQQTKLVIHPNSGHDNLSSAFLKKHKIPVILGNPIRAQAVSEYILSALFHHFTPLPHHHHWQRTYSRKLLHQQKILIIGFGHVGKMVEKSLLALGLEVYVYDPFKKKKTFPKIKMDVVIAAASLNKTSHHLINKTFFEKYLVPDFVLINPARGEIVQESHLISHLRTHPESFAYLDVFCEEPNDFKKLKLKNLNLTSHIAGIFDDLEQRMLDFEQRVLYDFLVKYKEKKSIFFKEYKDLLL